MMNSVAPTGSRGQTALGRLVTTYLTREELAAVTGCAAHSYRAMCRRMKANGLASPAARWPVPAGAPFGARFDPEGRESAGRGLGPSFPIPPHCTGKFRFPDSARLMPTSDLVQAQHSVEHLCGVDNT
jgi:hypothetical protein